MPPRRKYFPRCRKSPRPSTDAHLSPFFILSRWMTQVSQKKGPNDPTRFILCSVMWVQLCVYFFFFFSSALMAAFFFPGSAVGGISRFKKFTPSTQPATTRNSSWRISCFVFKWHLQGTSVAVLLSTHVCVFLPFFSLVHHLFLPAPWMVFFFLFFYK